LTKIVNFNIINYIKTINNIKEDKKMVTGDMNIMEAVEKYPVIVEVLQRNGLGCVGCMIASGETLAEGIEAHGLDTKAILDEINSLIKE